MIIFKFLEDMFDMEILGWCILYVEYDKYMFMKVYFVLNY